ncbi:X2-like carbohydrate binding domain-containing protein [Clostridium sp. JS66]|uniref:X2-like carbohydrate binding domain-containing protein n=1 Tax=Clostridium sp. JS66 TaxID=3064705 RepID=UPI00298DF9A7|nr:X2-like carbohydrate binding domain-containing protein [Clostridium sp. JS66]WPC40242.1 X2-like carbohydrate binding domain-containing protein [Clostridium sp. JS66]
MKKFFKKIMSMLLSAFMLLGLTLNFSTIKVYADSITYNTNLVVNGDGKLSNGVGSGTGSQDFKGWTSDQGSNSKFLVGNSNDFLGSTVYDDDPNDVWFDYYPQSAASETLYQTIDISSIALDVDSGNVTLNLSAYIRKYKASSTAILRVEMLDDSDVKKGSYELSNNSADDNSNDWQNKTGSTAVVSGTRKLKVSMIASISPASPDLTSDYIDFGDIKLTLTKVATSTTPTVTTSAGSTTFKEGDQPAAVDSGLVVSASQIASATVSITGNFHSSEDVLNFTSTATNYGNIAGSYNAVTGELTLTSSGATATLGQWQAALRSVTYNDTLSPPIQFTRTVSFVINDGTNNSAVVNKTITVVAIPTVKTSLGTTVFNWGNQAIAVDSGITVNSPHTARLASAIVSVKDTNATIYTSEDVLGFTNNDSSKYGNISGSYNNLLGTFTLNSSGATATLEQWQAVLSAVTYKNTSSSPHTANRIVSFVVNDGANDSKIATKTIAAVPIVTTTVGTTTFEEGGQPAAVDSGLTVSASKLSSATVSITGNLHSSEDVLGFTNNDSSKYGNISSSFTSSAGVLTLTSSGATASLAQWQAALQAVTYSDSSNDPNTAARTVSFVANDGTNDSNAATKTVSITAVNNLPTLVATALNPSYNAGNSAVALFSGTTASTVEAGQMIKSLTLTVSNVTDGNNEILAVDGSDVSLTNSSGSTANNNFAYVVSLTGSTATITISGDKSCTDEKSLIDGLTYKDSGLNPTKGNRIITLTSIQDNGGTSNGGSDTTTLSMASTVKVISVPETPTIGTAIAGDAQASVTFTVPTDDGGSSITGYTVTATPAGGVSIKTASGTSSPITVTGLTNGASYTFTVTATNGVGTSAASSASNSVTPAAITTEITSFDAIPSKIAGNAGSAIYANAAAVISTLPTSVTANSNTVTLPVSTWVDTDNYNPNALGSYTFTATLGTMPAGYANSENHTATVEVVVGAPALIVTAAPSEASITVTNNIEGVQDIITVTAINPGDIVKVYNDISGGSLLGIGTVALGETSVTINVSQLGVNAGNIYISVTSQGKTESSRTRKAYAQEIRNSSLGLSTVAFDKNVGNQADINMYVNFNGNTLAGISNGGNALINGTDYVVNGNIITIAKGYLSNQNRGSFVITFNFSSGNSQTVAVTIIDTTVTNTSGGGTTTGGSSTISTRTVDVIEGTDSTVAPVKVEITRTVEGGTKIDTVKLDEAKITEIIAKTLVANKTEVTIPITDLKDNPADALKIEIPKTSVDKLAKNGIGVKIDASRAKLEISKETLRGISGDVNISIKEVTDKSKIDETKAMGLKIFGDVNGEVKALGNPIEIEANITGRTKITIPIDPSKLPSSKEELDKFLSSLAVMVHHSDGEDVEDKGTIVYDEKGNAVGISIYVNKFSSFTLIEMPKDYFNGKTTVMSDKVDENKEWHLKFTKAADPSTVTSDNIYVTDLKGNKVEVKVSCDSDNIIKVSPVNPYKSGETYYIYISKKVTSKYKEPLTEDLRYEFTVK